MNTLPRFAHLLLMAFITLSQPVSAGTTEIAAKPPLGWNSFDSYGVYLHEEAAMANLEAMAEHLKPYGYKYFVIDNGWLSLACT